MNRKSINKEEEEQFSPQTIFPKFTPNWTRVVRFDRIVINVSDCQYQVVPNVAKQLKWKVKKDSNDAEWDVWWTDWAITPDILMKMEHHQKINHFPGMSTLSRKNLLAKNLMKMRKKNPNQYIHFPQTWNLPGDYQELKAYYDTRPKGKCRTFIVKPQSLSQGKGIFLTRKIDDINPQQRCVVQRYLSRPYLIDGLKFDLRIYVLLAGVDPLRVFIFHQGLGRFATQSYIAPNKDNMDDICMHLTNYAINKESNKFVFNRDEKEMGIGHKRSLQSVYKVLREKGVDVNELKLKINDIIVKTLISGLSHLRFQYRSAQPDNYRSDMCFQLLGFDVIMDQNLQPFVLQINYTPSFSTDTPLDTSIKKNLIHDTLILMAITKQFKQATVQIRKQCKDLRMRTGKKLKLVPKEKEEMKQKSMMIRDEYMQQHLGGFTQIYPLPPDHPRQSVYEDLIRIEAEASEAGKRKDQEYSSKLIHRNSAKQSKLPLITSLKDCKQPNPKSKSKITRHLLTTSTYQIRGDQNQHDCIKSTNQKKIFSDKLIKQTRQTNKKPLLIRETLVPRTIQFEGVL